MLAVALVAACGRTDESRAPEKTASTERTDSVAPSGVASRFVGTEWRLTRLHGREPLDGTSISLEIDRDAGRIEVGGTATCNFYGLRNPTMRNGVLKSRWVETTLIGCTREKERQEQDYVAALEDAATYRVRGDTLEIQDPKGKTTLAYEQESLATSNPADLVGTRWLLRSVNGRPLPDSFPVSVSFGPNNEIGGYDGCRHFTGHYYANENDLSVPGFGYESEEACLKPEAHLGSEHAPVLEGIPLEGNYTLTEERLEIRGDSGSVSVYEPLPKDIVVEEPGDAWVLVKFVEDDRVTPVLSGTEITLRFDRGTLRRTGTMSGSTGCNAYSADYEYINEFTSGTPVITSITEKACYTPAGVMEQEQLYLTFLEDTYWFSTDIGGDLELSTRDGEQKMIFVAPN